MQTIEIHIMPGATDKGRVLSYVAIAIFGLADTRSVAHAPKQSECIKAAKEWATRKDLKPIIIK